MYKKGKVSSCKIDDKLYVIVIIGLEKADLSA